MLIRKLQINRNESSATVLFIMFLKTKIFFKSCSFLRYMEYLLVSSALAVLHARIGDWLHHIEMNETMRNNDNDV